jgi:hypothetical protein
MASPIAAKLILCDAAQADPRGKIHMLGAGWSVVPSPTPPHAVAVLIQIPWDRTNQKLPMRLALVDTDGNDVMLDGPDGPVSVEFVGDVEAGRPPGIPSGSAIHNATAMTVPPLPLKPGRYGWRLKIAELEIDEYFTVTG